MLLAAGSALGGALKVAASGKVQCLKALLELARSDAPKPRRSQIIDALSEGLHYAISGGNDGAALVLLGACVEFNVPVNEYLSSAASGGRLDLVHALLASGAKVRPSHFSPCVAIAHLLHVDCVVLALQCNVPKPLAGPAGEVQRDRSSQSLQARQTRRGTRVASFGAAAFRG